MPIYEYRCSNCSHPFERIQKVGAQAPPCPQCAAPSERRVSLSSFQFHGTGFYTTDYARPASTTTGGSGSGSDGGGSGTKGSSSTSDT